MTRLDAPSTITADPAPPPWRAPLDAVAPFLRHGPSARALLMALELGVFELLAPDVPTAPDELRRMLSLPPESLALLVDLLAGQGALARDEAGRVTPTPALLAALAHRDLLEAKLFLGLAAERDLLAGLPALLGDRPAFMARAETFRLFDYRFAETGADPAAVARWVRLTTALTTAEAPAFLAHADLRGHARLLDVGGNSGEFARALCAATPGLSAEVLDLPGVCRAGEAHLARAAPDAPVRFRPADFRRDPIPGGFDLIAFKSVLHDWPDAEAETLLTSAARALPPGGRLIVFERNGRGLDRGPVTPDTAPHVLFAPWYRGPDRYVRTLERLGFEIRLTTVEIDLPFLLLDARKPA